MEKLENDLKALMLKTVDFQLDGKSLRRGKIKIYNTKQFHIKFSVENDGDLKEFELPYPFRITKIPQGYIFNYALSAFIPRTEEIYWKLLCMNKSEASRLHNNFLYVYTLSS